MLSPVLSGGLLNLEPDILKADEIASKTVINAITRNPLALIQLSWGTFTDYFDRTYLKSSMEIDVGDRKMEPQFHGLISKHFNYPNDLSSALDLKTFSGRYFLGSMVWFQFLLFTPVWTLLFLNLKEKIQRRQAILLSLLSALSVGVAIVLVERPTVRFLHISAWLFFLVVGVGLNRIANLLESKKIGIGKPSRAFPPAPSTKAITIDQYA